MSHIRHLNTDEHRNLNLWLKEQHIDLNAKKRRELSDVLPVAAIVKSVYTRLVDLNTYTPSRHSVALKLKNWEIFNQKVLKKLHMKLSASEIKDLAQGRTGAIESLFYDLFVADTSAKTCSESKTSNESLKKLRGTPKKPSKSFKECKESLQRRNESLQIPNESLQRHNDSLQGPNESLQKPNESLLRPNDLLKDPSEWSKSRALTFNHISRPAPVLELSEMLIVDAGQTINGKELELPFNVVPYDIYEEDMRKSLAKDAFIIRLEEKSKYLENIIKSKENRINVLMSQMCKLSDKFLYIHSNFINNVDDLSSTPGI
ncbi:uncharacterized protein LOC111081108 [Drosophila obscura]|uniref:uncharacterized protein LOC111081108 n=1 Tax=Drosophila obscura TaxID=7282 RepID=UPI000BA00343|nr:uncharacterized protein LOC111081108 [Drosophila obscura]